MSILAAGGAIEWSLLSLGVCLVCACIAATVSVSVSFKRHQQPGGIIRPWYRRPGLLTPLGVLLLMGVLIVDRALILQAVVLDSWLTITLALLALLALLIVIYSFRLSLGTARREE